MGGYRESVDIGGGWIQRVGAGGRKRTWRVGGGGGR